MALPAGAVIGTASLRRQAQTLNIRPDLKVVTLRGSVQTRLKRLADGDIDATFLALAGLTRLGLADRATALVDNDMMPPAPGQGALAVTCRAGDTETRAAFAKLNLAQFDIATTAERAFLAALDGSCRTPIGALATLENGTLSFMGDVLTPDGSKRWRRQARVALGDNPYDTAGALGRKLGAEIRAEAGPDFQPDKMSGW
jgi:hydroxymethylbilane synthase